MHTYPIATEKGYTASVVVSPLVDGEDQKNQDRARFFEPGQSACLCDGVTSSPNSAKAAELATSFAPTLFQGNVTKRLEVLCDLLMAHRQESMVTDDVRLPEGTPEAMRKMLQKVVQSKKAESFQTTIIAAQFVVDGQLVVVRVVKCGDSALFAFSPDGELLMSSLALVSGHDVSRDLSQSHRHRLGRGKRLSFGPEDEILVRIDGPLSEHKSLAHAAGIAPLHAGNWIVCTPVDSSPRERTDALYLTEVQSHILVPGDRLVVPKFLYGKLLTSAGHQYLVLRYSSSIRVVSRCSDSTVTECLGGAGSSTLVLPDHFYAGAFDCFTDTFPEQTQFLLCSDGFYGAFSEWGQIHRWLDDNVNALDQKDQRQMLLEELHAQLRATKGDDDISFIWLKPRST